VLRAREPSGEGGDSASTDPMRALVADDQPDVLEALRLLLKREGFTVVGTSSPSGVLGAVDSEDFDVALLDLNYTRDTTSGAEGLDLLSELRSRDPALPVVVMTAWGGVEGAVEAMRRGARDYVQKPWDNQRLLATLRSQVELSRALRRSRLLREENDRLKEGWPTAPIAESKAMQALLAMVERVGPSGANVLITGEHGTGKEVVARHLHAISPRAERPLVPVNAGGLPEGVFESELFGHVRGAFTDAKADRIGSFALADRGTLFLDEIGNMPPGQQAKLLRVLQTGELHPVGSSRVRKVDVRVIAATNADLEREVREGRFREDLLYRLNTVELEVPPLRERPEDVVPLANHFLRKRSGRARRFSAAALQAMRDYAWPGNVRELEHAVERAVLLARGDEVEVEDLALRPRVERAERLEEMTLEDAEKYLIQRALGRADGNVSDAARLLGLSRSALYRRLQLYGLKVPSEK
jgi:DNA-binding NtrC family response regulator